MADLHGVPMGESVMQEMRRRERYRWRESTSIRAEVDADENYLDRRSSVVPFGYRKRQHPRLMIIGATMHDNVASTASPDSRRNIGG